MAESSLYEFYERVGDAQARLASGFLDDAVAAWESALDEFSRTSDDIKEVLRSRLEYAQVLKDEGLDHRSLAQVEIVADTLETCAGDRFASITPQEYDDFSSFIRNVWGEVDGDGSLRGDSPDPIPGLKPLKFDIVAGSATWMPPRHSIEPRSAAGNVRRVQSFNHASEYSETPSRPTLVPESKTELKIPPSHGPQSAAVAGPALQRTQSNARNFEGDSWFSCLELESQRFLDGKMSIFAPNGPFPHRPARIAILDTGFEDNKMMKEYRGRIINVSSFIEGERPVDATTDESGHGTAVAFQIFRTCPMAHVYIAKVIRKDGNEWVPDKDAVAAALRHAADEEGWGVDIINMSFGWTYNDHPGVESAIQEADRKGVLIFASTSNSGLSFGTATKILYPAADERVFAVDAAHGNGQPAAFNPPSIAVRGKERFTAPGVGLRSPVSCNSAITGATFSSPLVAGVAALLLEFARQHPLSDSPSVLDHLKKRHGMLLVLRKMAEQKGMDPFYFVCPWSLLTGRWSTYGGDGSVGTPRWFVAHELISILRGTSDSGGYGPRVGIELFPVHDDG